jgi:hypothetical protein
MCELEKVYPEEARATNNSPPKPDRVVVTLQRTKPDRLKPLG